MPKLCWRSAFILVLVLTRVACAADAAKNKAYESLLPPVTFDGNTSISLDTDKPKASDLDAPPALTPLRQDSVQPYVGLKLTKPLDPK